MSVRTVFFDIGDTLGSARVSPPPSRFEGLDLFPFVPGVLRELRRRGLRLGIISNTLPGDGAEDMKRVLKAVGIAQFFEPVLLLYSRVEGLDKSGQEIFRRAAERAGAPPAECMFVGEDSRGRKAASDAGMRVCPHPLLASASASGAALRFAQISVPVRVLSSRPWRDALRAAGVVPLHVSGENGSRILAILAESALPNLINALFEVQLLGEPDGPLLTDVYWLRDDRAIRAGFLDTGGQAGILMEKPGFASWLLGSSEGRILVALPASETVESLHLEEAKHGHNEKLIPDGCLLRTPADVPSAVWTAGGVTAKLGADEIAALGAISAVAIESVVCRYSGVAPLGAPDNGPNIVSRHIQHPDNARCVSELARDLARIGNDQHGTAKLGVQLHRFTHEGAPLYNVIGELRGSTPEVVLVSAHLDSTAAFSHPFDARTDAAPGADDDASGIAAVLVIAEVLATLAHARTPRRTLRFVLFNGEEHGLIGSKAYAKAQAAAGAPIVAVFQMDMIGYNREEPRSFEIHVGYSTAPQIESRSRLLADRVVALIPVLSPGLTAPQIYGTAANQTDPAEGRSDHAPFHERGYAACVSSEDFFVGPALNSPEAEPNPDYHMRTDTFVDSAYAADIARVIAGAAWQLANL